MRTLYLYVLDTLADWEPGILMAELCSGRYLREFGMKYRLVTCGRTPSAIRTMGGLKIVPDMLVSDISPADDDVLLLPGADTWLSSDQKPVLAQVRTFLDHGVLVAATCGATLGLASEGLLDNRPHTSNDCSALSMVCPRYQGRAYYRDEPAVTDDNLITASGLAPVDFAYHVLKRLDVMHPSTLEAWYGLFTTRSPAFYFALMQSLQDRGPGV